jgi:hypothetical protein
VFYVSFEILDHGGRRGNTAWALARWQQLAASHEATDALHQTMCLALHHRIHMAIKIASI